MYWLQYRKKITVFQVLDIPKEAPRWLCSQVKHINEVRGARGALAEELRSYVYRVLNSRDKTDGY